MPPTTLMAVRLFKGLAARHIYIYIYIYIYICRSSRLKSGNACHHSVQNILSSRLLSKNLKIKIYRAVILLVVLYGCETWSLTVRDERRLWVFENRVLRRIFGARGGGRGNGGVEETP
jgi:hypothetical protein